MAFVQLGECRNPSAQGSAVKSTVRCEIGYEQWKTDSASKAYLFDRNRGHGRFELEKDDVGDAHFLGSGWI